MRAGTTPTRQAASDARAGSLYRSNLLLTAIARGSRKGSTLAELVARTGLPRPTIHRVLDMLRSLGWVERDDHTARYNLGPDLAALGHVAVSRHPVDRVAATELSALAERLNQVVYLNVRSGLDMVCIGRYESESQISVGKGGVGMRGPFGMSQGCLAMMSRLPKDEVQRIVEANLPRYHRIEGFDERGFRKALAEAIRTGYGTYDNIILDRTTSGLGVPVCDPEGYPVAAIGTTYITGWLTEAQRQSCLAQMRHAAARIGERLFEARAEPS
jgi:DNA-binding IclR family transcriptional regulator